MMQRIMSQFFLNLQIENSLIRSMSYIDRYYTATRKYYNVLLKMILFTGSDFVYAIAIQFNTKSKYDYLRLSEISVLDF